MTTKETPTYQLLHFVDYIDFKYWDVKSQLSNDFESSFKIVSLGDYIQEENHKIKPSDYPTKDFEILGVNNKTGIFDAYIKKGVEINQKYKKVENGYLAYNPYRINVGSIGLKTDQTNYKYISPAYVVFSCKKELLPEYLFLLFKTVRFSSIIRDNTTGSVRQNLSISRLGDIQIPLPSTEDQERILQLYNTKLIESNQLKSESQSI